MPPHSTTIVAPVASTASGAAVLITAVRLRSVRKPGSATASATTRATSAITGMNDVRREPSVGPPLTGASSAGLVMTGVLTPSP